MKSKQLNQTNPSKIMLGQLGEQLAVDHLKKNGYEIIERNFRCPAGEMDIVAKTGGCICFVEVRTRSSYLMGHPLESISMNKKRKIREIAVRYIMENSPICANFRFDVIGVTMMEESEVRLEHIRNAMYRGDDYDCYSRIQ